MTQKILAGRAEEGAALAGAVRVRVDQVVIARDAARALTEATRLGAKKAMPEVAVAYDPRCLTTTADPTAGRLAPAVARELAQLGVLVGRPGVGFAAPVHLERFASPARLAVTDEPRLAAIGGASTLALVVPPAQLAEALATGWAWVRAPRTVQVLLAGRMRPFVSARDVALELLRRGLEGVVERVDREAGAPVVLEFVGPSARTLTVPERAVLCGLAPRVGAAAAVFLSDEKTEAFLRDQRRSKAHRALVTDAGSPCDATVTCDLSAVDPLVLDGAQIVAARELGARPLAQVVLGGDIGASLRDLLAAAALLKSKRVGSKTELLLAPPSRLALEALAHSGALADLVATGARVIEPDDRLLAGELYPPPAEGLSLRTYDPEPGAPGEFAVASAETLAYAVANGGAGDPRSFKRPVRLTVPRTMPTDEVLLVRKGKSKTKIEGESPRGAAPEPSSQTTWSGRARLVVGRPSASPPADSAFILGSLEEVRWVADRAAALAPALRAVVAEHIPAGAVPVLAGAGVLALTADAGTLERLRASTSLELDVAGCTNGQRAIEARIGEGTARLDWLAVESERQWTLAGAARGRAASAAKPPRGA
ncbi:MAG: 3-isopropylmalate dehydratase [Polyangiaceae bacterium]|nr:3-isopropylmalate dehydratase [Polyangiaceae bacterium]